MSTHVKIQYGTATQSITCSCSSLADNGSRESTAIDNTSNRFLDALVQGAIVVHTASDLTATVGNVKIYGYGTGDGGTTYSGGATGSDAAFTDNGIPQDLDNCPLLGVVACLTQQQTYEATPMSVANAFGGVLPDHWGIIVENQTGQALGSSVGNFWYQGIYAQTS